MKQQLYNGIRQIAGASAFAVLLPLSQSALAQNNQAESRDLAWAQMQEEIVSAEALLSADFHNGLNPIGSVDQLVLNVEGDAIEYILYDVPYPISIYGYTDGFTTFEGITFWQDLGDITIMMDRDQEPEAPEELRLTRSEADHRLVSNIINEPMSFEDGETRVVQDLLVDRDSGDILYYVVDMDADSLFSRDRRTIPADRVSIQDDGSITASTDLGGINEGTQQYDESFL